MTVEETKVLDDAMEALWNLGCAVVVFTPDELGDTDTERLQEVMIERGWDFIG